MIKPFKLIIMTKAALNLQTRLAIRFGFVIILAHGIRRIISIDTVFKEIFGLKSIFNKKYLDKCLKSFGEVGEWLKPVPC